jgi:hypothetical protein
MARMKGGSEAIIHRLLERRKEINTVLTLAA